MRNLICLIMSIIIIITAFGSVYSVAQDLVYNTYTRKILIPVYPEGHENDDDVQPIRYEEKEVEIDPRELTFSELEEAMKADYKTLKAINPDCVGWINIPNVGYYPIVHTDNNSYYLNYNEYKQWNDAGAPFLDKDCTDFNGVALVYGHHYVSGKMFGALEKYKQKDFFESNENITLFDGERFRTYKAFTVYIFKSRSDSIQTEFSSDEDRRLYLKEQEQRSINNSRLENYDFNALFLQTCDYTFYNARLVVGFMEIESKGVY